MVLLRLGGCLCGDAVRGRQHNVYDKAMRYGYRPQLKLCSGESGSFAKLLWRVTLLLCKVIITSCVHRWFKENRYLKCAYFLTWDFSLQNKENINEYDHGMYLTMTKRAAIIIPREHYPEIFYVSVLAETDDTPCGMPGNETGRSRHKAFMFNIHEHHQVRKLSLFLGAPLQSYFKRVFQI